MKIQRLSLLFVAAEVAASADENNYNNGLNSVLLHKPELLAAHYPDSAAKNFELLKGTYELDGHYKSFDGDDTRKSHAKAVADQLNTKSKFNQNNNNNNNRNLFTTGHLADLILEDCRAGYVYSNTDYDDGYQPICGCIYNELINEVVMECYLGDENCSPPPPGESVDNSTCIGTHEIFFFSDEDGDLSNKLTCTVCRSGNCDGINEVCTQVGFNSENEPVVCQVIQLPADETIDVQVCEECSICGDDNNKGVEHSCFANPTNGCDTESFAHLHNFASETTGGPPIGGLFGDVCALSSPDRALYSFVTYDAGYSTICDCDDPSLAAIECDLYDDGCHANLCTDISERFFFNSETGDYEAKWTVNWNTALWTQVIFDSSSGVAKSCSVIGNDPSSGELLECTNCQICISEDWEEGIAGIAYDCFGSGTQHTINCDPSEGRATFNFETQGGSPTIGQSNSQTANESEQSNLLPAVLAALFGGMALAFIIVLAVRQRNPAPAAGAGSDDMTVDESVAPPSVVGGNPAEEPEFAIGDLEGDEAPPATGGQITEEGEELKPSDSGGVMT